MNNGWKQTGEFPKRMADNIKAVKEKRRKEMLAAIHESAEHVKAELAKPPKQRAVNFQRPSSRSRVATIRDVGNLPVPNVLISSFPYTNTNRARRWLKKHKGYPVPQSGVQVAETV